jgi:hypothetical protein
MVYTMPGFANVLKRLILPPIIITVLFTVLTGFMLIIGLLIYRVFSVPDSQPNVQGIPVYEKLALIVILAWMALMIAYYGWQIYFYNYNYGKSSAFWKKFIQLAGENDRRTEAQLYKDLAAPNKNPFFDQTFGLPPGTVRGTLALTVMVGGLCLLILAIGGSDLFSQPAFERQLNFFEQAFLMVIAFYFGTKGFEILQQEQTKRIMARPELAATAPGAEEPPAKEIEEPLVKAAPATEAAPVKPPAAAEPAPVVKASLVVDKAVVVQNLDQHYPHVVDLEGNLQLQPEQIALFAEMYGLEVPAVKAVVEIESSGKGFLRDGRPKILFEGHVFWRRLKAYKVNPVPLSRTHPNIVYQNWTRQHYLTGTLEFQRLAKARAIHDSAALESASWGMFQIMGYHAYKMGYKTVQEFVRSQKKSEEEHLKAFGLFITKISPVCHKALQNHQWAEFAKHYNGAQYAKNQYDTKLERSYNKFKGQPQLV